MSTADWDIVAYDSFEIPEKAVMNAWEMRMVV